MSTTGYTGRVYHVGMRLEISGAPVKADNGFWLVAITGEWRGDDTQIHLYRVQDNGNVTDEPPYCASASWYRRNRRGLTAAMLNTYAKPTH
jgi:hypothetical protein